MDGDDFSVSVLSDLQGVILDSSPRNTGTVITLRRDYTTLPSRLLDENGKERTHHQKITVLEAGPAAVIAGVSDGQYLPPGQAATLSATESFDYDNDIVLYEWRVDGSPMQVTARLSK